MMAIRQCLSNGVRGDQERLKHMRCVEHNTVSGWKAICELLDAIEGKCHLSDIRHFQPTHAREIARVFRKRSKDWGDGVRDEIAEWVNRCEVGEWTVTELRSRLLNELAEPEDKGDACRVAALKTLHERSLKFGTIYADPPWKYGNQATRASTDKNYATMTVDEIAALPVKSLVKDKAHLHLWTTNAFVFDCTQILEAWGFEYKSMFVWVKPKIGIGNYWRVSHELLILGVRGNCRFRDRSLRSWISEERTTHSTKPHSIRKLIEKASPGPRLELFARAPTDGWVVWGNQISESMFNNDIKRL